MKFKKNQIMITALAVMIAVAGYLNFAGSKVSEEEIMNTVSTDTGQTVDITAQVLGENDDLQSTSSQGVTALTDEELNAMLDISEEDADQAALEGTTEATTEQATTQSADQAGLSDIESLDSDAGVAAADYMEEGMADMAAVDTQSADVSGDTDIGTPGEAVFTSAAGANTLSGAKLLKEQTRAKNKEILLEIINNTNIADSSKQEAVSSMIAITDIAEKETAAQILLEAKGFSDVVVSISDSSVDVVVNAAQLSEAQRAQIEDIVIRKTGLSADAVVISTVVNE